MTADKFSSGSLLEALGSSAVRLQLHFLILLHNFLFEFSFDFSGTGTLACAPISKQAQSIHCCGVGYKNLYACPSAETPAGRVGGAAVAPFFGASNASKIFASMRGPNSTCAWSRISISRRFILARPTSWC